MSRCSQDRVIVVDSSFGEKAELVFIPPMQQKSADFAAKDEVFEACPRLFPGNLSPDYILVEAMDDNAWPQRAHVVDEYLEEEDICLIDWPSRSPDFNHIKQQILSSLLRYYDMKCAEKDNGASILTFLGSKELESDLSQRL
ncbi:hypothetical protein TNCV_4425631 [Trichonephila clavipes]|nr:hypothetical protein TNCV_4425631 [Trichonephila clavipes]